VDSVNLQEKGVAMKATRLLSSANPDTVKRIGTGLACWPYPRKPDGLEIVNLVAFILLALSLLPYGIQVMMQKDAR
jgi:hypothetical protein